MELVLRNKVSQHLFPLGREGTGKQILREAPTFSIASAMARVRSASTVSYLELGVAVRHLFRFYMFHLQRIENAAEQGSNPPRPRGDQ
jgi:hypothetical protein